MWRIAQATYDPRADADGDGRVDDSDLAVWRANFGQAYVASAVAVAAVVPQIARVAAPQMMADHAEFDALNDSTRSAPVRFVPMFEASVGVSKTPLAGIAAGVESSGDPLVMLAQDDGLNERRVVERVLNRHHGYGDVVSDSTGDHTTVLDEVFAEFGETSSLARSIRS